MQHGVLNTAGDTVISKTFGEQFAFDMTGNWLSYKQDTNGDGTFEVNQTRTHNTANGIQTISGGNTLVSHDRNGCMTKVPKPLDNTSSYTLVYDAWNRLISVSDGDTPVATYMYDARNHRIKKTVGTVVTLSYFNQNWQEIESIAAGVTTTNVYGLRYIDDVVCRMKNTEVLYALQDPNWNVVAVLNSNGSVAERITYDSFGRVTFRNSDFTTKVSSSYGWTKTFTGQVYDSESGLMLYRNRYYHTGLGRFITRDPIGYDARDINLYRYVGNMPHNVTDLLGLEDCPGGSWSYTGQSLTIGFVGSYVRSFLSLECMKPNIKYRRYTCGSGNCTVVIDKAIETYTQVNVLFIAKGIGFNLGISVSQSFGGRIHGYSQIGNLLGTSGGWEFGGSLGLVASVGGNINSNGGEGNMGVGIGAEFGTGYVTSTGYQQGPVRYRVHENELNASEKNMIQRLNCTTQII